MKKFVVIAMVLGLVSIAIAADDTVWTGGGDGSTWSDGTNWSLGVPDASIDRGAFIDADGAVVNITGTGNTARRFFTQGTAGATGTATVNIYGEIDTALYTALGKTGGTGIMNVYAGADAYFQGLSVADVGAGTLNMHGGTVKVGNGPDDQLKFGIAGAWGNVGTGIANLYGGTLDLTGAQEIRMATNAGGGSATLNIAGGSLIMPGTITDLRGAILTLNAAGVHLQAYGVEYAGDTMFVYTPSGGNTIVTAVPEPATIALLGLGGLALIRRKRS